jgi:hypothetical protein
MGGCPFSDGRRRIVPVTVQELLAAAADAGLSGRIDELGDTLEVGAPEAAAAQLDAVAGELGVDAATVRQAAIAARVARPDYGAVLAAMEERLGDGEVDAAWAEQPEGQMYLQSLAASLAPLAGLDVQATRASARTFLANFPQVSLPFGDVDERAANWLARLHDSEAVRTSLRDLLALVGDTWAGECPLASEQARRWGTRHPPADPTADAAWMRALVALVRSEL